MREPFLINEFTQQFIDRGRAKSVAERVFLVLRARGIAVPPAARERIANCRDIDRLNTWIDRAMTADSIHDVLDD